MNRAGALRFAVMAALLGATSQTGRPQQRFNGLADCVSPDCAAAPKSYSFEPPASGQESRTPATIPPRQPTNPNDVREGAWHQLPGNFVRDQKDI